MSRGKRSETHSVEHQGKVLLDHMLKTGKGTSKYKDKLANAAAGKGYVPAEDKIYITSTFTDYMKSWEDFCKTMKESGYKADGHTPRTFEEAKGFVPAYLDILKERPGKKPGTKYSAWTVRKYFAGVGKVLGVSAKDYDLPTRHRKDIIRSRGTAARDAHFSEKNHADLVEFCCCTGLRNASELQKITGNNLVKGADGSYYIHVIGKGKKERVSPIVGTPKEVQRVIERMQAAGDSKVWSHVPSCADVHDYRAVYATRLYNQLARDPKDIPLKERYCCRADQKGKWYDRKAVLEVSKALGHARENVIVEHYLGRH